MFEKCKNCKSYNDGRGTKKCIRCGSYIEWGQQHELTNDIYMEILPDRILDRLSSKRTLDVLDALRQLPIDQSAIISMYYFGGLTTRDIAAIMSTSKTHISRQLRAGVGTVKKILSL